MIGRIYLAILLYIIILLSIFLLKPAMMFDAEGNIKHFNYDAKDTTGSLLNIEVVLVFLALFCYFVIIAIELMI